MVVTFEEKGPGFPEEDTESVATGSSSVSSPTQDTDQTDTDQEPDNESQCDVDAFVIRFTPLERYKVEDVEKWLDTFTDTYVIAEEYSKQGVYHFHLVVMLPQVEDTEIPIKQYMLELIHAFLYHYWPDGERKRGWGSKQFNCQQTFTLERAISYAIKQSKGKERKYIFKGFEEQFILQCLQDSYDGPKKDDFGDELQKLRDNAINTSQSVAWMLENLILLKAKYDRPVNISQLLSVARSWRVQSRPEYAIYLTEQFMDS